MENENHQFKLKICRIFRSSFISCKPKNITLDVIPKPPSSPPPPPPPQNQNNINHKKHQLIDLFSPKPPRPFPSMCRPRSSHQTKVIIEKRSLLSEADFMDGQKCPPASPASPNFHIYPLHKSLDSSHLQSNTKPSRRSRKTIHKRIRARSHHEFPVAFSYNGLYSSSDDDENHAVLQEEEEEDDRTTLFSSRSLSSDSSESFRRTNSSKFIKTRRRRRRKNNKELLGDPKIEEEEEEEGKMKDSLAVVKSSRDPYSDFRRSMVEMIIEKQIFSDKGLENLLHCFLCLNSYNHHKVIIQVFTEIWETLFRL
ncbi:hypothetical protein M9H77_01755 [Catharanthus roseus]|uniref:Uncharacterized protein n=1 Tax=Catharanthus roseus TaxID=4058 RepID=A0ACC0C6E3_CATRO|nr:hypothetical protein M9H77_01755 [Catharanthus roseus]